MTNLDSTDLDGYDDIVGRLRAAYARTEFRPHSPAPRRGHAPLSVGACAAGLAIGLVAITSVNGFPGLPGSAPAAAWSATPSPLGANDQGAIDQVCRAAFATEFAPVLPVEDAAGDGLPDPGPTGSVGGLLAIEGRGDYGLAIYSGAEQGEPRLLACLTLAADGEPGVTGLWGRPEATAPRPSTVAVLGASTGAGFAVAFGTVDATVTGLEIAAPVTTVQATITGGYFLAFWPEADDASVRASATDADGTVVWSGEVLAAQFATDEPVG